MDQARTEHTRAEQARTECHLNLWLEAQRRTPAPERRERL